LGRAGQQQQRDAHTDGYGFEPGHGIASCYMIGIQLASSVDAAHGVHSAKENPGQSMKQQHSEFFINSKPSDRDPLW
jgi:hypothetical protein